MDLNPCINLSFDGQCEAAFKLYERCLNGTITFMLTWGESPMAADAPVLTDRLGIPWTINCENAR
jgi:PhnB protein